MDYTENEQYLLKEWVISQEAKRVGKKTTIVCLTMENGHEVIGMSAVSNPDEYLHREGVLVATKDALRKVNEIVAYLSNKSNAWF